MISQKNRPLFELLTGVEIPLLSKMINAPAAEGRSRGGSRRLNILFVVFHGLGMNLIGSCAFPESKDVLLHDLNNIVSCSGFSWKEADDHDQAISFRQVSSEKPCAVLRKPGSIR